MVDEEQRFGVDPQGAHQAAPRDVDVLTLTATPIPRTLQMAVTGLRDMSLITTPPVDRRAIRTDRHALRRAGDPRGGRSASSRAAGRSSTSTTASRGSTSAPQRLAGARARRRASPSAHGQMSEAALEQTMLDFVEGRYDVLVRDGDHRERPRHPARQHDPHRPRRHLRPRAALPAPRPRRPRARSARTATSSCRRPNAMTDEARSRIEALERHTELGSGFQIASLDLELRGAGDLLGAEQCGTVATRRLRALLPDARRGRARAARRAGRPRRRPGALASTSTRSCPRTTWPTSACASRSTSASRARSDEAHVAGPRRRDGGPLRPAARRGAALRPPDAPQDRAAAAAGARLRGDARGVTLHLREDTPLDPAKITALIRKRRRAPGSSRPTCASRGGSTRAATASATPRRRSPNWSATRGTDRGLAQPPRGGRLARGKSSMADGRAGRVTGWANQPSRPPVRRRTPLAWEEEDPGSQSLPEARRAPRGAVAQSCEDTVGRR